MPTKRSATARMRIPKPEVDELVFDAVELSHRGGRIAGQRTRESHPRKEGLLCASIAV
jgi:hypothetical protein